MTKRKFTIFSQEIDLDKENDNIYNIQDQIKKIKLSNNDNINATEFQELTNEYPVIIHIYPEALKNNKNIISSAVEKSPLTFGMTPANLQKDPDILMKAVINDKNRYNKKIIDNVLKHTPDLQKNKAVASILANKYPNMLKYLSKDLRNNVEIIIAAIKTNPKLITMATKTLQKTIPDLLNLIDIFTTNYQKIDNIPEYLSDNIRPKTCNLKLLYILNNKENVEELITEDKFNYKEIEYLQSQQKFSQKLLKNPITDIKFCYSM
jgi:hypothetical protein